MSYFCLHCGYRFDAPTNRYNQAVRKYDDDGFCPNCGSEDFEEAAHCAICDDDYAEDQVVGRVCKSCLEKSMSVENAKKYGEDRKVAVELNGFLAWVFDGRIEDILMKILPDVYDIKQLGIDFCADDKYDFAEWLEEKHDAE